MLLEVLAVAVALGADAMSVCVALGVRWHGPRQTFRLAWHMGLFQAAMPLIGWAVGSRLAGVLSVYGKWLAAALVAGVGVKMLLEALKSHPGAVAEHAADWEEKHLHVKDPTRGWGLIGLSVATSIDALVVGVSLGLRGKDIVLPCLIIGVTAGLMAVAGVLIGKHAGKLVGRPAEILGALILIALGASFLLL